MTLFWALAGVMLILALLFILPGLLRVRTVPGSDPDAINVGIIRAQLAELEADLDNGRLDEAQYRAAREDLERELLADLSVKPAQAGTTKERSGRWVSLLLLVLVPALTITLYQKIGTRQIIPLLERDATPVAANPAGDAATFTGMVEGLAERLRGEPDNAEGWVMLARSYQALQRFDEAAIAYERAHRLVGDNAGLLTDYVDALVMANGGQFSRQAGALLDKALESQPNHVKALWLAGHRQYRQGDYAEAVRYWQRAADQLSPGSEDAQVIARQIREAEARLGTGDIDAAPAPPATTPGEAQIAADKTIEVRITLDSQLAGTVAPEDTVFVFARALDGPRMPLAIVRAQVSELPLTVTLDDSTAMMPTMRLSNFDTVTVGARVSRTGMAMPQSGDLQGQVSPVTPGAGETIGLVIDSRVP